MKIVMDIPEDFYNYLKSKGSPKGTLEYLIIETATPLDSFIEGIKGEIEKKADDYFLSGSYDADLYNGAYRDALYWCFDLLDKHVKAESEDKK